MNPSIRQQFLKYGTIIGIFQIIFTVSLYMIDVKLMANWWVSIVATVIYLGLGVMSVTTTRKMFEGYISFREAFSVYMLTVLFAGLIATVFSLLLYTVIDPNLPEVLTELVIEKTVGIMERIGAPDEQIDEAIKKIEESNPFSVGNVALSYLYTIIFNAVIGLIIAAATKKNKPIFESDELDAES